MDFPIHRVPHFPAIDLLSTRRQLDGELIRRKLVNATGGLKKDKNEYKYKHKSKHNTKLFGI